MIHRKQSGFEPRPLRAALRVRSLAADRADERYRRWRELIADQFARDAAFLMQDALFGPAADPTPKTTLQ
jgi:hypothetical protein